MWSWVALDWERLLSLLMFPAWLATKECESMQWPVIGRPASQDLTTFSCEYVNRVSEEKRRKDRGLVAGIGRGWGGGGGRGGEGCNVSIMQFFVLSFYLFLYFNKWPPGWVEKHLTGWDIKIFRYSSNDSNTREFWIIRYKIMHAECNVIVLAMQYDILFLFLFFFIVWPFSFIAIRLIYYNYDIHYYFYHYYYCYHHHPDHHHHYCY